MQHHALSVLISFATSELTATIKSTVLVKGAEVFGLLLSGK